MAEGRPSTAGADDASIAFYEPAGDRLLATEHTRGPWDPRLQHAGPPTALLARALRRCEPREDTALRRITFEILRPIPIAPLRTEARVVRPGRSVELLEGELLDEEGRELVRARGWRLRTTEMELTPQPPSPPPVPPSPETGESGFFFPGAADVGYHTAIDFSFVAGGFRETGPATVWMRMRGALVAGEDPTPLDRVLVAADSGNGVSAALDFGVHRFVNVDLSVHLSRPPAGEWVCLEAETVPEPDGVGLADTRLWDMRGPIGRALQTLIIERRD